MTFRAIDVQGLVPASPRDQALPILQWIDVADLVIDDRYQRPLEVRNRQAIQQIADAFDWMQFSPVLVAPADGGRFAVIDGQHRVHAAQLCGIQRVPAQIVLATAQIVLATAAQQAQAFAGVNAKVTPMTLHQVYRAALVAGEGWAIRCRDVVEASGCTLATANPSAKDRKPRVVYCIGVVRRMIVQRGMADALGRVLSGLVAYDTSGRVALYSDFIVTPMAEAVFGAPDLVGCDLPAFLRAHDPFRVLDRAAKLRANGNQISNMQALRAAMQNWMRGH